MPFVLFITVLLCCAGYYLHTLDRVCGVILLLLFGAFFAYLFKMAKASKDEVQEDLPKPMNPWLMLLCIVGGLGALVYGSDLTVSSAIDIAHRLSISDRIIGLTIVAIGTSLPELVTCVIAALKKQPDLAVGNIIGSNIFNILFILGLTCVIQPVGFDPAFILDGIVAVVSTVVLFAYTCGDRKLTRWEGCALLVLYAIYLGYLIIK
jgi:cation:H+ antiporter